MNCSCAAIFFLSYFCNSNFPCLKLHLQAGTVGDCRARDEGRNNDESTTDESQHMHIAGAPSVSLPEAVGLHGDQFPEFPSGF